MNITFTGRFLLLPELVYLSVYLFKTCVYGINNGISCGVPVGSVYCLVYAVTEKCGIIGGKSAVDITTGFSEVSLWTSCFISTISSDQP